LIGRVWMFHRGWPKVCGIHSVSKRAVVGCKQLKMFEGGLVGIAVERY
jgi:hypothetical protein